MKNEFQVIQIRTKVWRPNTIIVRGWYKKNKQKNEKIVIFLDGERLTCKATENSSLEIKMKYIDNELGIDTEYVYEAEIPEGIEGEQSIRVIQISENSKKVLYELPVTKIRKMQTKIVKWIEVPQVKSDSIVIRGWCISRGKIEIKVYDKEQRIIPYEMEIQHRKDVVKEYPEVDIKDIHGFELILEKIPDKKVLIVLKEEDRESRYWCALHTNILKKSVIRIRTNGVKAINYCGRNGVKRTVRKAVRVLYCSNRPEYERWRAKNVISKADLKRQRKKNFSYCPKISIVVPLYKTNHKFLDELIRSVQKQTYDNWELCLSDGSGNPSFLAQKLDKWCRKDVRIKVVYSETALQISDNTNRALEIVTGDFIAFADHDDLLAPNALFENVKILNRDSGLDLIYSDEDKMSMDRKEYYQPHFKPDFNLDFLRSNNYICHLLVVRKELVKKVGRFRSEFNGSQDYDFVLRCIEQTNKIYHIPKILYHWRMHKESTSSNPESKMYAFEAGANALRSHYKRVGIKAEVTHGRLLGLFCSKYELTSMPKVSIVIANKDHIEDLEKCLKSIIEKNTYKNYEIIIVENNSEQLQTFEYYKKIQQNYGQIKVVYWEKQFNYSSINNFGVEVASGEYIWLLNNDTEIINEDCLQELLGYCMREDVGAVGSRLYYPDGTIQHAGVILGMGGIAGHAFACCEKEDPGYFGRIICIQNVSAVTAASILIKRAVFDEVGGLNEEFAVAFNDVDFCMKVRKAGYLIVYNPYSELYHYESKSRGNEDTPEKVERFGKEVELFASKWPEILKKGDPYYNVNLDLDIRPYGLKI